jgi:hypothetical protein
VGRACPLCPGSSDINLFGNRERVIDLDAEIADRAFDLGVTKQELYSPKVASAPVDQRGFGPAKGMGAEHPRIKPDACHPATKKARILTGCQGLARPEAPGEQVLTWFLAGCFQEVVDGLPGLIGQFELDRSSRLLLAYDRAIDGISIRRDIFDPQGDDVATTKLTVDGKIEQRKVSGPLFDQQSGSDRPDLVWPQRRLGTY